MKFVLFLLLLLVVGFSQIAPFPVNDIHKNLVLNKTDMNEDCVTQLRNIFTPNFLDDLWTMVSTSGKGLNHMGDFQYCNTQPDFEYAVIAVVEKNLKLSVGGIGICTPKNCANTQSFAKILEIINQSFQGKNANGLELEAELQVTSEINAKPFRWGAYLMFTFFIIILILWIAGIGVQHTNIGNKPGLNIGYADDAFIPIQDRKEKWALILYSFNPIVNLSKLMTVKEEGDKTLAVLNGVRVLSICWVIVGHGFSFIQFSPVINYESILSDLVKNKLFAIVPGGLYAVDSFFFLSGFLTFALITMKAYPKRGRIPWHVIIFHRYYRLIFPLLFVTGFAMFIMPHTASGPIFRNAMNSLSNTCNKNFWQNFLFINNLFPWRQMDGCIGWVWYLANDFQFFLMSPPIILAYCNRRMLGYLLAAGLLITSMIINGSLTWAYEVTIIWDTEHEDFNTGDVMYSKPWSRMGAYFVGAILGLFYFEYAGREKYPELSFSLSNKLFYALKTYNIVSYISFIVGFGLTALYVFPFRPYLIDTLNDKSWNLGINVLYNMTCRPFFVLGIGLIIMPTFVGKLSPIKALLSSELFAVLARLNYMVYMIHCLVLFWYILDTRQGTYATFINLWFLSIGATVVSFLFAIPCTLMCEVPFMNIETYVLFPSVKKEEEKPQEKFSINSENEFSDKHVKYYPIEDTIQNHSFDQNKSA